MPYRPWLHRYAIVLVIATFGLLVTGGTVTSHNAGLAVEDWPTSFGYNMFTVPLRLWIGPGKADQFFEHSHRLKGALVGFLTIGMAAWLWATQRRRPWLVWFGVVLLLAVIVQGIMGGLRVTEVSYVMAFVHGVFAQLVLCMTVIIAAATGRLWLLGARSSQGRAAPANLRYLSLGLIAVLLVQLLLGAAVRHTAAGLAIPDFPLSYGRLIPPLSQERIDEAIKLLPTHYTALPYKVNQVAVAFAHRTWAWVVVVVTLGLAVMLSRPGAQRCRTTAAGPAAILTILLVLQVLLGAVTIWMSPNPEFATAHQAVGAALLAVATLLAIRLHLSGLPSP